jgi:hypothetical protein
MLKMLKSPLVRSSVVLALLGGVAVWNFKSIADAACSGVCFESPYVWVHYKNPCLGLRGSYIMAAFVDDYSSCHPVGVGGPTICLFGCVSPIAWEAKCPTARAGIARSNGGPTVCIGFFPPCRATRNCPCTGCTCLCINPDKEWYDLSSVRCVKAPSGCPLAWIQFNRGLCVFDE